MHNMFSRILRLAIFACSMISLLPIFAQSAKSDELFAKGVELYRKAQYDKAAEIFRQVEVEDSLNTDFPESRNGYASHWRSSSLYHAGREEEAKAVTRVYYKAPPIDRRETLAIDSVSQIYYQLVMDSQNPSSLMMAEFKLMEIISMVEQKYGENSMNVFDQYVGLSIVRMLQNDTRGIARAVERLEEIYDANLQVATPALTGLLTHMKAAVAFHSGDTDKAMEMVVEARSLMKGAMKDLNFIYNDNFVTLCNYYPFTGMLEPYLELLEECKKEYISIQRAVDRGNVMETGINLFNNYFNIGDRNSCKEIVGLLRNDIAALGWEGLNGDVTVKLKEAQYANMAGDYDGGIQVLREGMKIATDKGAKLQDLTDGYLLMSDLYLGLEDYKEAENYAMKAQRGFEQLGDAGQQGRMNAMMKLAIIYSRCGRGDESGKQLQALFREVDKAGGTARDKGYLYYQQGTLAYGMGRMDVAESLFLKAIPLLEPVENQLCFPEYYDARLHLCTIYKDSGWEKANAEFDLLWKDLQLEQRTIPAIQNIRIRACATFAQLMVYSSKYDEALSWIEKAYAFDPEDELNQRDVLRSIECNICLMTGRINEAIAIAENICENVADRKGKNSMDYASSLQTLILALSNGFDINRAVEAVEESMAIIKEISGEGAEYFNVLPSAISIYTMAGNASDAFKCLEKARNIAKKRNLAPNTVAQLYKPAADLMLRAGRYDEALEAINNAIVYVDGVTQGASAARSRFYQTQADIYMAMDDNASAIDSYNKSLEQLDDNKDTKSLWIGTLLKMASAYTRLGNVVKYRQTISKALELMADINDKKDPMYFYNRLITLDNMMKSGHPDYDDFLDRTVAESDSVNGEWSLQSIQIKLQKINRLMAQGRNVEAFLLGESINTHSQEIYSCYFSDAVYLTGYAAYKSGYYEDSKKWVKTYKEITGFSDNDRSVGNTRFFVLQAINNLKTGNIKEAVKYYRISSEIGISSILSNFLMLSSSERADFWNNNAWFYRNEVPWACKESGYDAELTKLAYDNMMFSTGLLLESDRKINEVVAKSEDPAVESAYREWSVKKNEYDTMSERISRENSMEKFNAEDLLALSREELQTAERNLLAVLKESAGDYNRKLSVKWQDVKKALRQKEVAVEFVELLPETNVYEYYALLLKSDWKGPEMIKLFEMPAEEMPECIEEAYNNDKISRLIWKPLLEKAGDVTDVYFAAQGNLHNVAIEYVPGIGDMLAEGAGMPRIHRLSSTRELVLKDSRKIGNGAVIYGGIEYGASIENLEQDAEKYPERKRSVANLYARDTRQGANKIMPLPGTHEEALKVAQVLESAGKIGDVKKCLGVDGSEVSFKDLDTKRTRVVHVATHGYYLNAQDMAPHMMEQSQRRLTSGAASMEDLAMERCGLLMSGANHVFCDGEAMPEGIDDGILTAKEIARLDLGGLDLVTLSACETARGDINTDGVFGLQRAFKKAGANSLIMSLWKVDDDATQLLMTIFYDNFAKGKSKYDSFAIAREAVKEKYPDPEYWAAFIMLDAI